MTQTTVINKINDLKYRNISYIKKLESRIWVHLEKNSQFQLENNKNILSAGAK